MWIAFKDRQPPEGEYPEGKFLITRFPGRDREGDSFESWRNWKKQNLDISFCVDKKDNITHWWEGPSDMDIAIQQWYKR